MAASSNATRIFLFVFYYCIVYTVYVSCLQSSCTIATSSSLAKSGYGDTSLDPHQDGAEQVTIGQSLITDHLVPQPEAS